MRSASIGLVARWSSDNAIALPSAVLSTARESPSHATESHRDEVDVPSTTTTVAVEPGAADKLVNPRRSERAFE